MNPLLTKLQPYPFERLRRLTAGVTPNAAYRPISLGIGEPKHATPEFIKEALVAGLEGLANYPATAGEPALRAACAQAGQPLIYRTRTGYDHGYFFIASFIDEHLQYHANHLYPAIASD